MNERPQLRRKVTFKRRSNVIQLTTFFESLNQQYEQELKEQQEKKGSLAPEEEQKILSDSPYPFDFEEEEGDNEEQDSNTETESASEQQLNGPPSAERVAPSKKDVYPEKLNVKVTTVINSSSGDLKSETKKENPPTEVESNNNNSTNHVEDDTVSNQSSSGKVANLKNVWELKQQQQEEEALKERQMRDLLRAQKEAAMIRRKSKPHDVHISAPITPNSPSTTSRPALIQPSPRPETPTVSPTTPEKTPKDKKPKSPKSPKSPRKPKDEAEDKNNHKTPNGVEANGPSVVVTEPPAPQKPVPIEVESPKTISESVFSGNTKSQSDPVLQSNTNDQSATGDELRNSMSTPNLPAQTDSGPTSMEVSTPKKSRDKDKDKKRDKDKDKTRTKTDSPKLKPKEKEKSRRSSSKKKDGEPENGLVGSSSGVNTNATNTPSKSGKEKNKDKDNKDKDNKDKESIDKKIAEIESPSTKSHKRSSTDLYDKYNDTKPNKRNKTKRMLSANGVDGKSPKDKGRKKKKKKDPTIELTELKDSFARWKPTMLTHSWEIDGTDIEFIEKIGEGTSCSVYKGKFRNQIVALKVLKDLNDKQLDNFTKEFTIMSQFRSPDIVFFFGACIKPTPVMVLGYGERGSLYSVMKDPSTALTWPIVVKVLHQVVRGLHSLHNWKPQIVHRDLKSRNILVDNDWQTKLCDFGESRQLVGNNLETLCKMRGTYAYISPEVYFGQSFTPKSDVYAFAIVAWELVTKCIKGTYQPPYAEFKTLIYDFQIIVQAARRGIRPTIDKACPVALASMIHRCWNHIPDVRPSTDHLLKFLEEIMAEPDPAKWINVPHVLEPPAYTMPPGGGPPPPSSTDREK